MGGRRHGRHGRKGGMGGGMGGMGGTGWHGPLSCYQRQASRTHRGVLMNGFTVRSDPCQLDFLALGALVHRLDPGIVPFRKARAFDVHVSGGEYNVAAGLADCFGLRTGIATAMVNYGIGELVQTRVRETGVTPFYKWFEHDGVRGPNFATVYSDRGHGVRAPVVFYNRANEAGALLKPGDFDWPAIFAGGVRWFHSGGIFAALSETTSELILEGMHAAKAAGAVNSFDLNYRAKLWKSVGGLERASAGAAAHRRQRGRPHRQRGRSCNTAWASPVRTWPHARSSIPIRSFR